MRRHSNERRTDNVRHSLRREREREKKTKLIYFYFYCYVFPLPKEILIDEYDISFVLDNALLFLNFSSISNYFFN